jgi:hypothetical protein
VHRVVLTDCSAAPKALAVSQTGCCPLPRIDPPSPQECELPPALFAAYKTIEESIVETAAAEEGVAPAARAAEEEAEEDEAEDEGTGVDEEG